MIRRRVLAWLKKHHSNNRAPDFIIGPAENPYLHRWFVIPRNPVLNIYFHRFMRSDEDRALHDHPWINASWLLKGSYDEIQFDGPIPWDAKKAYAYLEHGYQSEVRNLPQTKTMRRAEGSFTFRYTGKIAHRVRLLPQKAWVTKRGFQVASGKEAHVWTLFITGPRYRQWGFHCPKAWKHWKGFVFFPEGDARRGRSEVGPGCD